MSTPWDRRPTPHLPPGPDGAAPSAGGPPDAAAQGGALPPDAAAPAGPTHAPGAAGPPPDEELAVLRARAAELARVEESPAGEPAVEALAFRLAHEAYAVETASVREVSAVGDVTPVPCTPASVRGLVNVRGQILTVIDLKPLYGLPDVGRAGRDCVVIVRDGDVEVGILADEVTGIVGLPADAPGGSVQTPAGLPAGHVKAVVAGSLILLDVQALLADPRLTVNEVVGP